MYQSFVVNLPESLGDDKQKLVEIISKEVVYPLEVSFQDLPSVRFKAACVQDDNYLLVLNRVEYFFED